MHRSLIVFASVLCAAAVAKAGPLQGELFGYRLGDKYELSQATRGRPGVMGGYELIAENPTMPPGFKEVRMMVTTQTYTIANIFGRAEFRSLPQAEAFAAKYTDLLNSLYSKSCAPAEAFLREKIKLLCSGKYQLTLRPPWHEKAKGLYEVTVGLKMGDDTAEQAAMIAQFQAEQREHESEIATRRINDASKKRLLDGLQ